jgi:hypothetical protein
MDQLIVGVKLLVLLVLECRDSRVNYLGNGW